VGPDAGAAENTGPSADAGPGDAGPIDAGPTPDAGPTQDAGPAPDAGSQIDAGNPLDGGPLAQLDVVACPSTPQILWTRSVTDADVDFRGATDESGNLYWLEYQPPWTPQNTRPPAFLTSADANGKDRFRVPASVAPEQLTGSFMVGYGKVFMTSAAQLAAYDATTGAQSWTLDLGSTFAGGVMNIVDAGNGNLVLAIDTNQMSGVYAVNASSGAVVSASVSTSDKTVSVQGSDGKGSVLLLANLAETPSPPFERTADLIALDAAGRELWRDHVENPFRLLAWPSTLPWYEASTQASASSDGRVLLAPDGWFSAAANDDFGFAFDSATLGPTFALGVNALRGGKLVASGLLPQLTTFNGVSVLPFLAGDHAAFVAQQFHSQAGLCHPGTAGAAFIGHVDTGAMYLCPIAPNAGDSPIDGAALLPGELIIGRRTVINEGCGGNQFQPFTIEAYSMPGESLSTFGWVQAGGSPGLGRRPR
jgi:outer membrane protein assembly factor BamB